jgi:hypothetical protein
MYRLREMTMDDKVCEQVSMTMLNEVYPKEVIERCVQQSDPWNTKVRRVRLSTALSLVLFVIALALWSRRNQCQLWLAVPGGGRTSSRRLPAPDGHRSHAARACEPPGASVRG